VLVVFVLDAPAFQGHGGMLFAILAVVAFKIRRGRRKAGDPVCS
jgi:hypothetical protein